MDWLRAAAKYQTNRYTKPIRRVSLSTDFESGKDIAIHRYTISMTRLAANQPLAAAARLGSFSACQLRICRKAPNTGEKIRLQLAAALGFQIGGATRTSLTSSTFATGGA